MHHYIHEIKRVFGFYPKKLKDIALLKIVDDYKIIKKKYRPLLDRKRDTIYRSSIIGWAEREQIDVSAIDYASYQCPQLERIKRSAMIGPDGTFYGCCLDEQIDLVLGNIYKTSIHDIHYGEKRTKLIEMLANQEFKKIGQPCNAVNTCQQIHLSRIKSFYYQIKKLRNISQ